MLNPNNDRLDYGKILSAPVGYSLDFAVGTTYSLDLDALTGACLALGLSEETDSELMYNPICLLEALRSTGDKVALFCEGGQIHLPNKATSLYVLLEKMVYQVNTVKRRNVKGYPSFHPKFWLLRFVKDAKDVMYRVVILSRNLTFDRSWDVSFYMDGTKSLETTEKNSPVIDFLSFLSKNLGDDEQSKEKAKKIRSIMKELPAVHFSTGENAFYDFEFIPSGIKATGGGFHSVLNQPLFHYFGDNSQNDGLNETFIMSPFISNDIIKYFNDRSAHIRGSRNILITRAASLGRLKQSDCSRFEIYTLKDAVVEGEGMISEDGEEQHFQNQDIHAKVFMTRKNTDTDLYLGSLNASHNAVFGNIEFMIRLKSRSRYLNINTLTASLFDGAADDSTNPFQKESLSSVFENAEEEKVNSLDLIIKQINRMLPHAVITEHDGSYDVCVTFGDISEIISGVTVTVSPLIANKTEPIAEEVIFTSLPITDLSLFYCISVSDGTRRVSRVLKIETDGMPDGRESAIVSSVVNDKACFYRYIAFLLGDNLVLSALESEAAEHSDKRKQGSLNSQIPALYEKMLQTAATAPERFKEIDYLIKAVAKDGVVPEYFEEMYNVFRKVVKV